MKKLLGIAALAAFAALPVSSFAATYAYVNSSGNVATVDAASPQIALTTAPNIDIHSGVILLQSLTDAIVGNTVNVGS